MPVDWWRPGVAGVTLVSCFCRSCRGRAAFGKAVVGGVFVVFAGSGFQQ
jgi:hypothetical protein